MDNEVTPQVILNQHVRIILDDNAEKLESKINKWISDTKNIQIEMIACSSVPNGVVLLYHDIPA